MKNVEWGKCANGAAWCPFTNVNVDTLRGVLGIYIVWHEGNPGRVVYVGSGDIGIRIEDHRTNNREILSYQRDGALRVTWAAVPTVSARLGMEQYLADFWQPLVGDAWPDVCRTSGEVEGSRVKCGN